MLSSKRTLGERWNAAKQALLCWGVSALSLPIWAILLWCNHGCGQAAPPAGDTAAPGSATVVDAAAAGAESLWTRKEGSDWPRFLGPQGTGISPERGIRTEWPKEGLPVVWRKRVDTGYGMPSIRDGRLYQFDRRRDRARLTCLQAETGRELWNFEYATSYEDRYGYNNGPRCAPLLDDGRVFLYGPEGMLHALEAKTGKPLWNVDTQARYGVVQNFFGVGSCPVVFEDKLLVQVGGSPPRSDELSFDEIRGNGSGVVAFDKATGVEKYRVSSELASYATPIVVEHLGRPWCFVFARGGLLAFDPRTGKEDFRFPWRARILESVNAANPVFGDGKVLVSECYGPGSVLVKVGPTGPETVWQDDERKRDKTLKSHWCTPILLGDLLFGCSGRHSQEAELRCIDFATGRVLWAEPGWGRCSLTAVDGHLLCWSETGELRLLEAGKERCKVLAQMDFPRVGQDNWAAPILAHGLLYLRAGDELVCLELIPAK